MMLHTRLNVDAIEALMGQARKGRILRLLMN